MSTYEMWLTGLCIVACLIVIHWWGRAEALELRLFAANEELARLKAKKNVIETVQSCVGGKCDCS